MIGVTFSTPWVMAHKLCFEGPSTSELSSHTLCVFQVSPVSYQVKERWHYHICFPFWEPLNDVCGTYPSGWKGGTSCTGTPLPVDTGLSQPPAHVAGQVRHCSWSASHAASQGWSPEPSPHLWCCEAPLSTLFALEDRAIYKYTNKIHKHFPSVQLKWSHGILVKFKMNFAKCFVSGMNGNHCKALGRTVCCTAHLAAITLYNNILVLSH